MAACGVVNTTTTTTTDSCPATVRSSRLAGTDRANRPIAYQLSDAEIARLVGELVTLEAAAQRGTTARPS